MPNDERTRRGATPLARRLQRIMDEMHWTQSDLARAAKCPRQTVNSWMSGANENMTDGNHALNIQGASKFNALWIMTGKGPVYVTAMNPADEKLLETLKNAPEDRKSAIRIILPGLDI